MPEDVIIFRIHDDGRREKLAPGAKITSKDAVIIIDFIKRQIIMWRGSKISVHKKFAAARNMTQLKMVYGVGFKTLEVDEKERKINIDRYLSMLSGEGAERPIEEKHGKTTVEEKSALVEIPPQRRARPSVLLMVPEEAMSEPPAQTRPAPSSVSPGPAKGKPLTETKPKETIRERAIAVLEKIERIGVPEGYERDVIVIGDNAYAYSEIVTTAFGKKTVRRKLEKITTLPEGVVLVENYIPRLLVENGKILAIEFLRKSEKKKEKVEPTPQPSTVQKNEHTQPQEETVQEESVFESEEGLVIESPLDVAEKPLIEEEEEKVPKSSLDDLVEFFKKLKKK